MTVKLSDVSVVLQGPVRFETPESVESVRRLLPEAELILSTWEDEDVSSLLRFNTTDCRYPTT